jgi:peroxiredoxin
MAQLRHDYEQFKTADTDILVIVPNGRKMIEKHVQEHNPPYRILSDKGAEVARHYGIQPKGLPFLTAFRPALFLVDKSGRVIYTNYTSSYIAEPDNQESLALLAHTGR